MIGQILRLISVLALLIWVPATGSGQQDQVLIDALKEKIMHSLVEEGFDSRLVDIDITSTHTAEHNGATYVYYRQKYQGVEVYRAVGNLVFNDNLILFKNKRLVNDAEAFLLMPTQISPEASVHEAARHLDLPLYKSKGRSQKKKDGSYTMSGLPFAMGEVAMRKVWAQSVAGQYSLAWAVEILPSVNSDHWEVVIDANNGAVLDQVNSTLYCHLEAHDHQSKASDAALPIYARAEQFFNQGVDDGSRYRAFAVPIESPALGQRTLIENPADPTASPLGWHDNDGIEGPEFTILRGNNVHAYQDTADIDGPGEVQPSATEGLTFDFPFDRDGSVLENLNADLTNLFYWNNVTHDWAYNLGFDEGAGNFQQRNYTGAAGDADPVQAETLDGSSTNNATFSSPRDGSSGRMQMFKWTLGDDFEILSPAGIGGNYSTGVANFGPSLNEPLVAEIVLADDNLGVTTDACEPIVNVDELTGKIAMIDRGDCDFSFKVHAAQEAGAIACLICNNLNNAPLVSMAAGENSDLVNIPSLFLSREDCNLIKARLNDGVTGRFNETRELSSAFDNGIVVHEYGHGITMRLSGGRTTTSCLSNDEQMGEGWSDFFGLVLTQRPEDNGSEPRGIGTYVVGEPRSGRGIRRFWYSTDMEVNPQIHSHVRFSFRPHDVGEVWVAALWDMYWGFIDQYGYDPTWADETKGNVIAMRLVFDGLKLQDCDPSLIEARDGIIEADQLNNLGENNCLIWTAFARRGLGVDAQDNDTDDRHDNVDGFQRPPSCDGLLTLDKRATGIVDPGEQIEVILTVENFKENMTDVVVTDQIPDGVSIAEILSDGGSMGEGNTIRFELGDVALGDRRELRYKLSTEGLAPAQFEVYDNLEGAQQFDRTSTNTNVRGWALTTAQSASGIFALRVAPDTLGGNSFAQRQGSFTITEANRLLKFNHKYEMSLGIDGGVIEVSRDNGDTWEAVPAAQFLVGEMPDEISNCFNNCPFPDFFYRNIQEAFTGTKDWQTTVVDLGIYMGEEVLVRFNHISLTFMDEESLTGLGWLIDDFELLEKVELTGEACVTSGGAEMVCDQATTLVNSQAGMVPVTEVQTESFFFGITPNPADDHINIELIAKERFDGVLRIINVEGKVVSQQSVSVSLGENLWTQDITSLQTGMHFLELSNSKERTTLTFIKQ